MRTVDPSSSCTRAEPWICANSRSVWLLSQHDFESAPLDRAVLDLRRDRNRARACGGRSCDNTAPLFGRSGEAWLEAAHEQIGRTAIDRNVVDLVRVPRSLDDRLVVAGDEAVVLAEPRDLQRREILLEEGARLGGIGDLGRPGLAAGIAQGCAERRESGGIAAAPAQRSAGNWHGRSGMRRGGRPRSSRECRTRRAGYTGCR